MSVNKVIIKGRLGKDPETTNGVVKFSVATSEKYEKNGKKVEKTQWHNIVAFAKLGEILSKYFKKGDEIFIVGKIEYNEHEGKYYTSIIANEFDFVGSSGNTASETPVNQPQSAKEEEHDDLPFS